ncbi:hypothetical protein CDFC105_43925 [Clostridioides difficile]|nr:hypothetical protein CDFC105_43925 [Clostridioides difficile]
MFSRRGFVCFFFFLMRRRPPRSTRKESSAASDVYKRQILKMTKFSQLEKKQAKLRAQLVNSGNISKYTFDDILGLSLIHISEPTRLGMISYAVFCLKKKKPHY